MALEALERAVTERRLNEILLPPAAAVAHLAAVTVDAAERARLLHGMAVPALDSPSLPPGSPVRVLDETGALLAMGRWEGQVIPVKVLAGSAATDDA